MPSATAGLQRTAEADVPARRPAGAAAGERIVVIGLAAALGLLRVVYAYACPVDSDEPQHLHVAWAWTKGLVQYRDVFDNHAPLFHLLSAPLVALIGEDARILLYMRLAMIPVFAACLYGSYVLGRSLFGARAGWWAALLCGLGPTFFFKSVEYRTDVLWAALWVLAVATLLGGPSGARRGFSGGLLAGACLAVSLKTVMLLAALGIAAVTIGVLCRPAAGPARRRSPSFVLSFLAGCALIPGMLLVYFAARGAWGDLVYCTIRHNLLPGVGRWGYSKRIYLLLPILALLVAAARFLVRRLPGVGSKAAFLLLLSGSQYLLLSTVWPVHTRQDLLPFYPLLTVLLAGVLLCRRSRVADGQKPRLRWDARGAAWLPALLACVELAVLPMVSPATARGLRPGTNELAEILKMTDPADYVLDPKGQSVFRNRPYYYALETMTLERIARGLIPDNIQERCVETSTCVAPAEIRGFPPRARRFLEDNYVVVGAWRVAGVVLPRDIGGAATRGALSFDIVVPARYAVVAESGAAQGTLDGSPYDGSRDLAPGRHEFEPTSGSGRVAVIWAKAAERGFTPFAPHGETP